MNIVQIAKRLINTIEKIEKKATEKEFYELQEIISQENVDLVSITKKVLSMEQRIEERNKTERYRINISNNTNISTSIPLSQDVTIKQLVDLLEKECQSDILYVHIDYITREK